MNLKNGLIEIIYMFAPRKRLEYYIHHNNVPKVQRLLTKGVNPNPTKKEMRNAHMKPNRITHCCSKHCVAPLKRCFKHCWSTTPIHTQRIVG